MTRLQKLRQRAIRLHEQMEARLDAAVDEAGEPRVFTEEEQSAHDADQQTLDRITGQIATEERLQPMEPLELDDEPTPPAKAAPVLDGTVRTDARVTEDREAKKPFATFGEQLLAIRDAADPSRQPDKRLLRINQEARAASGLSESVPADGGFQVQSEFISEIRSRMHSTGAILSRVRRTPIGPGANGLKFNVIKENSRADGSRYGGVRGYWKDEAVTFTASKPELRQVELKLNKLTGLMYETGELRQDAPALGARAVVDFGDELRFKVEDAIWSGDGAGKPLGVVGHAGTVSVAKEAGQAAATVVHENIVKMWARMRNRQNAVWMINQDVEPQLNTMTLSVGTGGSVSYLPAGGLSQAPFATLMGRPVIPVEYASTLGTVGDITLCDWEAYEFIDKGGMRTDTSMHVRFLFDEEVFRIIYRCDGQPLHNAALTPYKGTNTQSHFITLATRS